MKQSVIFLVCVFCAAINLQAQYKINVQNGTKTAFYDNLETAISSAEAGDTLYLPGTVILVGVNPLPIDKKLAIIGAGWDVDSIGGLQTTEIKIGAGYVNIQYNENSSGSLLTGCMVSDVRFVRSDANQPNAENVRIWRNRLHGSIRLAYSGGGSVKNITISENCISGDISGNSTESNCMINNNTCGQISSIHDARIFNNIARGRLRDLSLCTVENNFINDANSWSSNANCTFNNNAYRESPVFSGGSNSFNNYLTGQAVAATFITNNISALPKDLVVRETSPCKTGGTYGTEIGIYGGMSPYKPGGVPFNPHITKAIIPGQTDQFGNLKVNISVSAQTK